MGSRLELQTMLTTLLGSENVYFRPPPEEDIVTPAIIYNVKKMDPLKANNKAYIDKTSYEIIFVDDNPDNTLVKTILNLPYCEHERTFSKNNNDHTVFTLYY